MSIDSSDPGGQIATEVYHRLLKMVRSEMSGLSSIPRRQNWRFQPPQRSPQTEAALRAYWGEVFKPELTALEAEWAAPRDITPITSDTTSEEKNVFVKQAS